MKCDELKAKIQITNDERMVYLKADVDAAIDELKTEHHKERDEYISMVHSREQKIKELEAKLEDAKATAYAESVDAGMRERKLKRALYKACANWAHHRVFVRFKTNEKAWDEMERKCRAKAEQYK